MMKELETMEIKRHCKPAFDKIPEEKQKRILEAAAREFAAMGFTAANINVIAKKAGISIGSMYNYFSSKEDLFLTVNDQGYEVIAEVVNTVVAREGDIFQKIETLIRAVQKYARLHTELNQIYLDITSQGLSHLSRKLSNQLETITAGLYHRLIREAQDQGIVSSDIDPFVGAFCIDNLIVMLQYAYASDYFAERMKIFAGEDALENDEKMVMGIMRFIRKALAP
ncbi:MAG: TetR/AcrR family transcriptional regulator [Desulfobacteraceae bacterium]|nr:TetR/AcrR family transcriptional regulator [Desulfobacteraceae bacterium]